MLTNEISSKVLSVGPDYILNRGGLPTVIKVYSKLYNPFYFIPTYFEKKGQWKHVLSIKQIIYIALFLLQNRGIKVVHIHGASYGSLYRKYLIFLMCKYLFSKKTIYHIHSGAFPIFYENSNTIIKACIRHFVNNADMVVCLSEMWKKFYSNTFKPKSLIVLRNMVENPSPKLILKEVSEKEKIIFLFLGMIRESKGVYDLVKAASLIPKKYKEKYEIWIGGDGEVGKLKKYLSEHNLCNNIRYVGWLEGEKKQSTFKQASIFILPSHFEGLPVSILEAISNGMPVISTYVGGVPELVIDGYNGFLSNPRDVEALKENLLNFIQKPELIKTFSENSLIISQTFSADQIVPSIKSAYEKVLET